MENNKTWSRIGKILLVLIVCAGIVYVIVRASVGPINVPPEGENPQEQEPGANGEGSDEGLAFLSIPEGFRIGYYATDVPGARVMEWDEKGRMLVSQTKEGKITALEDNDADGKADRKITVLSGLNDPHGLAFKCSPVSNPSCHLYVAEHDKLSRYAYDSETAKATGGEKLLDLPSSATDRHFTRTLLFLGAPDDDTLLISVGSSCNVCDEGDTMRGKIMAYDIGTKKVSEYATGLRNAVFMTLNPINGIVFATEMARDGLGDDIPPDEINVIEPARVAQEGVPNFGWPICYGQNIHDTEFDKKTYIRNPCMTPMEIPAWQDLQAHSAPLGLSFIPEEGWEEDLWFDLLVAYHGSWNRSVPTGYKIVKIGINGKGDSMGVEDFITGWLTPEGEKLGRPADVKAMPGGIVYISDDMKGAIYRLERTSDI